MSYSWFIIEILIVIIVASTSATDVQMQTQQGIIYGRQTQNSIEYLG